MKKIIGFIFACIFSFCMISSVNADTNVAKINNTLFTSLDEAVKSAKDNDTIILLSNATTEGLNVNKNLTIDGKNNEGENYSITFTKYGIALWNNLTLKNTSVVMEGINATPYSEWNWMTICAGQNASFTLINTTMLMDNKNDMTAHSQFKGQHAIYFTGNNKLVLTNSKLDIKNYVQDAFEWDGGTADYLVEFTNSSFISDHNRSGFAGTFSLKSVNSNIDVINSLGNGSNGSHFELINSNVKFLDNGSHGLSAGNLTIDNSKVYANGNGANGIHVTGTLSVKNNSTVVIKDNDCSISSKWTNPGALFIGGKALVEEDTDLVISNNNGSGIYVKSTGDLTLNAGIITENNANKLKVGGGINNNGKITISPNTQIYNNNAEIAGDDIYSIGIIDLAKVVNNKYLKLSTTIRKNTQELNNCEDLINGWYVDSENERWNAHDNDLLFIEEVESSSYETSLAIKAAHNLKGNVIIHFADEEGNTLLSDKTLSGYANTSYITNAEEIDGYTLVKVIGEENGTFKANETIEVTYIYQYTKGQGTTEEPIITPPHTSSNGSVYALLLLVNILGISVLLKNKLNLNAKKISLGLIAMLSLMNVNAASKWDVKRENVNSTSENIKVSLDKNESTIIFEIPEDYEEKDVTINVIDNIGGLINKSLMPGFKLPFKVKIINNSKYNYIYKDGSLIIGTDDYSSLYDENNIYSYPGNTKRWTAIKGAEGFDGSKIMSNLSIYRTYNIALQSLFENSSNNNEGRYTYDDNKSCLLTSSNCISTILQDKYLGKELINQNYENGVEDLHKYYLDFYNKKYSTSATVLEDLTDEAIYQKGLGILDGNRKSMKETNSNVNELGFNWFYNRGLFLYPSSVLENEALPATDKENGTYSIGSYMRNKNNIISNILLENSKYLANSNVVLPEFVWDMDFDYLVNAHMNMDYMYTFAFTLDKEVIKGKLIVNYVDEEGNELTPSIITEKVVGEEYSTIEKEFDGYTLIKVEGNTKGKYTEEDTVVTYIYQYTKGQGTVEEPIITPPHTSSNGSVYGLLLLVNILGVSTLLKKKEN